MGAKTSAFDLLKDRAPISWIRERDIDLLICSELHANTQLQALFARKAGFHSKEFRAAWVSHAELEGENDLVLAYSGADGLCLMLVENKISALLQPDQGLRYAQRAHRWRREPNVSRVATVLMAPTHYQSPAGEQRFDVRIDYEEISHALKDGADQRSLFLLRTLEAGIESARRGYIAIPNVNVSDMWMACWQVSTTVAPRLRFQSPGLKPGRSTWFYFRQADGFSDDHWRKAVVVLKAERGQADLQFGGLTKNELASRITSCLSEGMEVVSAVKSASIRIKVTPIDFSADPKPQLQAAAEGLSACERLRDFFVTHRERLLESGAPSS